jgi:hypothetical protein
VVLLLLLVVVVVLRDQQLLQLPQLAAVVCRRVLLAVRWAAMTALRWRGNATARVPRCPQQQQQVVLLTAVRASCARR